jgi:acetate kinase
MNAGSSTVKVATFTVELREIERLTLSIDAHAELADVLGESMPHVVAHRIVHGGPHHDRAVIIDDDVVSELTALVPLAPLHLPAALQLLAKARQQFPDAKHVACFDTAFHHGMPDVATRYPLPSSLLNDGIRKYGFHGLSCEHVVHALGSQKSRLVIAHLGAGCSVTAVRDGKSIDTSMSFTPLGGVIMASRPGDLDPGLLLHLLANGINADELTQALNFESGLRALAGTGDMQELLARNDDDAALAIEMFCSRIAQYVAASTVSLGGIDTLAFTGGIGEHAPAIRDRIVAALGVLGPFDVEVVPANEELTMARQALALEAG